MDSLQAILRLLPIKTTRPDTMTEYASHEDRLKATRMPPPPPPSQPKMLSRHEVSEIALQAQLDIAKHIMAAIKEHDTVEDALKAVAHIHSTLELIAKK